MTLHRPRLVARVPEGWMRSESLELAHPDHGLYVNIRVVPVTDGYSVWQVADDRKKLLERLPGCEGGGVEPMLLFGSFQGLVRRFSQSQSEGTSLQMMEAYWVGDGEACLISGTWPSSTEEGHRVFEEVVAGLRLLNTGSGRPVGATVTEDPVSIAHRRLADGELQGVLAPVADAVAEGENHGGGEGATSTSDSKGGGVMSFTEEELSMLGYLLGGEGFPGVDPSLSTPGDDLEHPVWHLILRTLVAREAFEVNGEGELSFGDETAKMMAYICIEPDLVITATHQVGDDAEVRLIHVNAGRAVEHKATLDGVHELELFPPEQVMGRISDFCGLIDRPKADTPGFTIEATTLVDMQRAAAGDQPDRRVSDLPESAASFFDALVGGESSSSNLRILRRDPPRIVGGELTWVDGGVHGLWLVEHGETEGDHDEQSVRVEPVAGESLRRMILDLLPGSLDELAR